MSYQLYRNTTIGNTLQESLDELIQYGQITPALAVKVLLQFDKSINQALSNRVKSRLTFKAGKLNTYRFCDNVWTFMLNDVEFREVQEVAKVDKVKIVACDGKRSETAEVLPIFHALTGCDMVSFLMGEVKRVPLMPGMPTLKHLADSRHCLTKIGRSGHLYSGIFITIYDRC